MMAGTFLDVESTNDQAAARLAEERTRFEANRSQEDQAIHRQLVCTGFSDSEAKTVIGIVGKHPETGVKIAAAVDLGVGEATRQNPVVQSAWMFITDLFAASVPGHSLRLVQPGDREARLALGDVRAVGPARRRQGEGRPPSPPADGGPDRRHRRSGGAGRRWGRQAHLLMPRRPPLSGPGILIF